MSLEISCIMNLEISFIMITQQQLMDCPIEDGSPPQCDVASDAAARSTLDADHRLHILRVGVSTCAESDDCGKILHPQIAPLTTRLFR